MAEETFQVNNRVKLNDKWVMTGEEFQDGVYWPSTGMIGHVRKINGDELWVEFDGIEGTWPVESGAADLVEPMAEELAALDKEAQSFNPYAVNAPRGQLLEELYQLLHQNDILYSIEDDLLDKSVTDSDALTLWAELNTLRTALQEGEPAIIEDAFAPTSPTYPTPYAALAFHILNAKVAVLPESTWNNNWTPGQTVNELASEIERLQAALDQERADNVTLRAELQAAAAGRDDAIAEWQACHNILDTAQKYRAELFPKDLDNSWTGAIDRLAQGVRDERNWSRYLANKAKQYQQVANGDASIYDGLRTCKVCRDRETTRGDGVCEACYQQWMIDES